MSSTRSPFENSAMAQTTDGSQEPAAQQPAHTNALIDETSPYLRQHAHNPVNWYPWGEAAFAKAKQENKPIFLSVGYSTCYWCHVMEVESFEDPEVAAVLNEHFIAIKVDREERPDIDEQYMIATQLLTQRGGWPNSVWLTPAGKPWMAGTYFPKANFISVLEQLATIWDTRRDEVDRQAESMVQAAARVSSPRFSTAVPLTAKLLDQAAKELVARFEPQHGGFGVAPKFPPHGTLQLLLEHYRRTEDPSLLTPIAKTLDAMWLGGLHDHLGGGFHRYSTDDRWLLPHFEKMLYDNAQLMRAYADGFELTGEKRYRDAVEDIFQWCQREMTAPQGGFYSALDSGEVGKEGEAYVWSVEKLRQALPAEDAQFFAEIYNFQVEGNFAEEASGEKTGENIPHRTETIEQIAERRGLDPAALRSRLDALREKLLEVRQSWPQPHKDDKILTSWNGLMIAALARAGRLLEEPRYSQAAEQAADFILQNMVRDGRLLRTFRAGQAKLPAYLDDYTYFIQALLELYQTSGNARWLQQADTFAEQLIDDFEDRQQGGFFFTTDDHEDLLVRTKHLGGGGNLPNPNGVAAQLLIEIAELTGKSTYRQSAQRTLQSLSGLMELQPQASEDVLIATSRWLATGGEASTAIAAETQQQGGKLVQRIDPVTIQIDPAKPICKAGEPVALRVTVEIDEGWHLYAENPEADFLQPTRVAVDAAEGFTVEQIKSSSPRRQLDAILNQELATYAGEVHFDLAITANAKAVVGENPLTIHVTIQACDSKRCLPVKTAAIEFVVEVLE